MFGSMPLGILMVLPANILLSVWLKQLFMSFVKTTVAALWDLGRMVGCHASINP
jgi:hypothetical protein